MLQSGGGLVLGIELHGKAQPRSRFPDRRSGSAGDYAPKALLLMGLGPSLAHAEPTATTAAAIITVAAAAAAVVSAAAAAAAAASSAAGSAHCGCAVLIAIEL